jgi:hypothetical protein
MTPTPRFSINMHDIEQSLKTGLFTTIIPILIGFFAPIYNSLQAGQIPSFNLDWHLLMASLIGGVTTVMGSIVKRFLQDEFGNLMPSPTIPKV